MANVALPPTGTGSTGKSASTVTLSNSTEVQNVQVGAATEAGSFVPVAIATQATLASVLTQLQSILTALGTPAQAGGLTDTQLRATAVPVSGTVTASGPLTDTQLRATAVPVSGTVTANIGTVGTLATQATLASILAKQPALGTVGSPSADFITVQGNASGTPIPVSGSFSASGTTDLTATGNITASAQNVAITTLNGMSSLIVDVFGTFSSLIGDIQATIDGTNWFFITGPRSASSVSSAWSTSSQITTSAAARYQYPIAGFAGVRFLSSGLTSGTAVVSLRASAASGHAVDVASALPFGSNTIGAVQLMDTAGSNKAVISAAGAISVATELATGLTTFSNTALSNTKTAVKASAGKVHGWMIHNPAAATTFLQVWNVAIGSITVGTTAPTYTIPIPAGASANVFTDKGITHSTEINVAATTTATGSSAPATALVCGLFYV